MSTISWRRQSQHYDWLSGYLAARRLIVVTRALMAFLTLSYIVCLLALLVGDDVDRVRYRGCRAAVMGVALANPRSVGGFRPDT